MAIINNYVQSLMVLNTLNRNYLSMSRHMRRVTTGLRINSAADDPSGWAIGTRMQIEIRGLDQCSREMPHRIRPSVPRPVPKPIRI